MSVLESKKFCDVVVGFIEEVSGGGNIPHNGRSK